MSSLMFRVGCDWAFNSPSHNDNYDSHVVEIEQYDVWNRALQYVSARLVLGKVQTIVTPISYSFDTPVAPFTRLEGCVMRFPGGSCKG